MLAMRWWRVGGGSIVDVVVKGTLKEEVGDGVVGLGTNDD